MGLSQIFLRFGLGVVFLIFGIGKFTDDIWAKTMRSMPIYNALGGTDMIIYAIGAIEVITAICLILNFNVKLFALVASLELISILILLKFAETRDIGLLGASLALFFLSDSITENNLNLKQLFRNPSFSRNKTRKEALQWTRR